jgi:hypothetical protein
MMPVIHRALLVAMAGVILAAGPLGCAHDRRMTEIRTFEAGYIQLLQDADYDRAYELLHTEIKTRLPLERYRTYFTVMTDTLGPLKMWTQLPTPQDRIPLLERERRMDPLPPDKPKAMLEVRYLLTFEKNRATLVIRTGWDEGRLAIRGQFLCCMGKLVNDALQARAEAAGVGDLYGVKPRPTPPPNGTPAGTPEPPKPSGT